MPEKPTHEELEQRIQELEASESKSNKMLESLQQKELLYGNLFKNMLHEVHVWQLVFDADGNIKTWKLVDANPAALNSWNKTLSEVVGKTPDEMFPGSGAIEKFIPIVQKISSEGTPHIWESFFPNTNQFLHMVSIPLGEYFISTGLDVTERRQAEDALRQQHEMLKRTEAIAHVGSWEWDIKTDSVIWSEELYSIFQLEPCGEAPRWDEHPKLLYPEDFEKLRQAAEKAIADANSYEIDVRAIRKDGETRICKSKGFPEIGSDGNVVRLVGLFQDITETKRAEKKLKESEEKYRLIAENMGDIITTLDMELNITYVSPSIKKLRGFSVEESMAQQVDEIMTTESFQRLSEAVAEELKLEQAGTVDPDRVRNIELEEYKKDGSTIWVENTASFIRDKDKKPSGILIISRDITGRKQAEDDLRKSEERFSLAMEASKDGIWDWDLTTGHIYCSPTLTSMLGYDSIKVIENVEDWQDLIHPEDRQKTYQVNIDCVNNVTDSFEIEYRMKTRDGGWKWILGCGKAVYRDTSGKALRLIGTHHDITERKEYEKQLASLERRNQALLEHSPVCHKIVDLDFNLQYMSDSGFKMLKLDNNADVYGKPYPFYFFSEMFKKSMIGKLKKVKEKGEAETLEALTNDIEGNEVWLDSSLIPVFDEQKKIDFITVVSADVTQRKREEKEKELIETQLQQAQKMESIGSLAGGIAHDFNNLLFPIIGLSEMMLNDFPPDSMERKNIQEIFNAGTRGRELVQQILSFSRQSEHQKIPVHIQKILKEALKLCRVTIPADISITPDIRTDCGQVMADPTQIHQIAMNLITNAYHAVEPAGGTITVKIKEVDFKQEDDPSVHLASGRYAVLTVTDTGTGIDPAVINKLFDPYFTTKEKGRGTGLGLSTVYGIVKSHGGDIKVHSEVGKGSCFHVYLPLLEKAQDAEPEKEMAPLPTGTEHILLVDDETPIVHMEQQMLERLGYRITSFSSSVDALAAFRTDPSCFDLIITDMNMPNLNGMQLAEELNNIKSDIPVIICTGFSERINKENAATKGIKGLLMKPVVMKDLAHKVREVLK